MNDRYADSVMARLAMIISTVCLFAMDRTREAKDMLLDLKKEHDLSAEKIRPCAMFCLANKSLNSISYYRSGDEASALREADEALAIFHEDTGSVLLWIWPVYTSFMESYLEIWENALKKIESTQEASQILPPSLQIDTSTSVLQDQEEKKRKEYEQLIARLGDKVKESLLLCEHKAGNFNKCISSSVLRMKGNYYYCLGEKVKAFKCWEESLVSSRALNMTLEEGKVLYEIGRHKLASNALSCSCASKRSHESNCVVSSLEAANVKFIQSGAVYQSRKVVDLIQSLTSKDALDSV